MGKLAKIPEPKSPKKSTEEQLKEIQDSVEACGDKAGALAHLCRGAAETFDSMMVPLWGLAMLLGDMRDQLHNCGDGLWSLMQRTKEEAPEQ